MVMSPSPVVKTVGSLRAFLFDMDGTLTLGDALLPGAQELLDYLDRSGRYYALVTNNSSKDAEAFAKNLKRLGLSVESDRIITSTQATIHYLQTYYSGSRVYAVGTPYFVSELAAAGFRIAVDEDEAADVVVMGFDLTATYEKLATASRFVLNGARLVGANPDFRCPVPGGYIPDCGALTKVIELTTGVSPVFLGKPERGILEVALKHVEYPWEKVGFVGDRLYTDIEGAYRHGLTSVLVLSGESSLETLADSEVKPDYVYSTVLELYLELRRCDEEAGHYF